MQRYKLLKMTKKKTFPCLPTSCAAFPSLWLWRCKTKGGKAGLPVRVTEQSWSAVRALGGEGQSQCQALPGWKGCSLWQCWAVMVGRWRWSWWRCWLQLQYCCCCWWWWWWWWWCQRNCWQTWRSAPLWAAYSQTPWCWRQTGGSPV